MCSDENGMMSCVRQVVKKCLTNTVDLGIIGFASQEAAYNIILVET